MDRKDFQKLARTRLREAKALVDLRLPDGAYYLVGYAVECALKACIAKRTRRHDFPDRKRAEASYTMHPIEQAEALLRAINNARHGVLACIRRHW